MNHRTILAALIISACAPPDDTDPDGTGGSPPAICPVPFAPTTEPPTGCTDVAPCDDVSPPTCAAMYRCDGACIAVYDCACAATLAECGEPLPSECVGA